MTLTADKLIRRFMLHVLPNRFTKIKHYSLLSNRKKKSLLKLCRILIGQTIFNDFNISLNSKRKTQKFACKMYGYKNFMYSYHYSTIK